jgi:SAM-dependent methyltransferase
MTEKLNSTFDYYYQGRDFYFGFEPLEGMQEIIKVLKPKGRIVALDLGCGEGRDSIFLAENGIKVLSIDVSRTGIKKLTDYALDHKLPITAKCIDLFSFDFSENSFDIIVARTLLDHLEYDKIELAVKIIKRSVRKRGFAFIEVFTEDDPGFTGSKEKASECAGLVKYYFKKGELKSMFNDFRIIKYQEKTYLDTSHGTPHYHGVAILIGQKS